MSDETNARVKKTRHVASRRATTARPGRCRPGSSSLGPGRATRRWRQRQPVSARAWIQSPSSSSGRSELQPDLPLREPGVDDAGGPNGGHLRVEGRAEALEGNRARAACRSSPPPPAVTLGSFGRERHRAPRNVSGPPRKSSVRATLRRRRRRSPSSRAGDKPSLSPVANTVAVHRTSTSPGATQRVSAAALSGTTASTTATVWLGPRGKPGPCRSRGARRRKPSRPGPRRRARSWRRRGPRCARGRRERHVGVVVALEQAQLVHVLLAGKPRRGLGGRAFVEPHARRDRSGTRDAARGVVARGAHGDRGCGDRTHRG